MLEAGAGGWGLETAYEGRPQKLNSGEFSFRLDDRSLRQPSVGELTRTRDESEKYRRERTWASETYKVETIAEIASLADARFAMTWLNAPPSLRGGRPDEVGASRRSNPRSLS